jgi:1,4-alpha-glucan branching enzyme
MRSLALVLLLAACSDGDSVVTPDAANSAEPADAATLPAPDLSTGPNLTQLGATPHASGTRFRVWAPNAEAVWVSGDFNAWDKASHPLVAEAGGVWSTDVPGAHAGQGYQFVIKRGTEILTRHDPRARAVTGYKGVSLIVDPLAYQWQHPFTPPPVDQQIIYELHLGTFNVPAGQTWGTFDAASDKLDYLAQLGVNMIELMPPSEYRGDRSWGYNPQFPFAAESVYGSPDALRRLVDQAHARGMGVMADVVYNHWTDGDQPLRCFDGDCKGKNGIYFYTDAARAMTPWGPRPDFGRAEVRDYLRDNALMWLDEYRMDGLRWDSTVNVRAYDDGRSPIPDGWNLLRDSMSVIDLRFPKTLQVAEDLKADDALVRAHGKGGAGFDSQWDPSFFHPVNDNIIKPNDADRQMYAIRDALIHKHEGNGFARVVYTESHDEVANGRKRIPEMISPGTPASLIARKRSTLGAAMVLTAPGIPMLFMGMEFLESGSFADQKPLDWSKVTSNAPTLQLYRDLIALRKTLPGLRSNDISVFHVNEGAKVIGYLRGSDVIVLANFSNKAFTVYDLGVPKAGLWKVRFNSDDKKYGADYTGVTKDTMTIAEARDGFAQKLPLALGPYAVIILSP